MPKPIARKVNMVSDGPHSLMPQARYWHSGDIELEDHSTAIQHNSKSHLDNDVVSPTEAHATCYNNH